MYSKEDGWLEYVVNVEAKDPFPIVLYYKDPVVDLSMFFSSPANGAGFDFGLMTTSGSQQQYSIPSSGKWWQSMQGHVGCVGSLLPL
jgi:hypothetical protein